MTVEHRKHIFAALSINRNPKSGLRSLVQRSRFRPRRRFKIVATTFVMKWISGNVIVGGSVTTSVTDVREAPSREALGFHLQSDYNSKDLEGCVRYWQDKRLAGSLMASRR